MTAEAFTSKAIITAKLTNLLLQLKVQTINVCKDIPALQTFKPISKLTAYVVNYCKYLQQ
jgi:hypothetical protein